MNRIKFARLKRGISRKGATLSGYSLVVGLVAIVALAAIDGIGSGISASFTDTSDSLAEVRGDAAFASCTLDGVTVSHAQQITAYSADISGDCSGISQTRSCDNGALTGSPAFAFASCRGFSDCSDPAFGTVLHGASVTGYSTEVSANCAAASQSRSCSDGVLDGDPAYEYATCRAFNDCTSPTFGTVAHTASVTAYTQDYSTSCGSLQTTRTCTDGVLSGSGNYASCSYAWPCNSTPWGTLQHGESRTGYLENLGYGNIGVSNNCASISQVRTCVAGTLTGDVTYRTTDCRPPGTWTQTFMGSAGFNLGGYQSSCGTNQSPVGNTCGLGTTCYRITPGNPATRWEYICD
ncbi:MAG: hypothetical protein Alpg2KO_27190 [Alphaproteobacteria bacterium]